MRDVVGMKKVMSRASVPLADTILGFRELGGWGRADTFDCHEHACRSGLAGSLPRASTILRWCVSDSLTLPEVASAILGVKAVS